MAQGIGVSYLSGFIVNNMQYIIVVMVVMLFISLVVFININMKLSRMNKRYKKLMTGMDGCNIERLLMGHIDEVRDSVRRLDDLEQQIRRVDLLAKQASQKVGIIRFSAFEGVGSDLSYAIALLNYQNDGFVLSSIFGRDDSRCYAKPVVGGTSTYVLSDEEKQAIKEAMKK